MVNNLDKAETEPSFRRNDALQHADLLSSQTCQCVLLHNMRCSHESLAGGHVKCSNTGVIAGLSQATSTPIVVFMPEGSKTHMGGTMRLGSRKTLLQKVDCITAKLYQVLTHTHMQCPSPAGERECFCWGTQRLFERKPDIGGRERGGGGGEEV